MGLIDPKLMEIPRALVELRAAAEKEVEGMQRALDAGHTNHKLSSFEKALIRTAFKGGAVWANARHDSINSKEI